MMDELGTFEGYGSVFNVLVPDYNEIVMPGAFKRTLAEHAGRGSRPAMFWSHRMDSPIGIWESLAEDNHGLKSKGRLILDSSGGREAHALMKGGAAQGLSIGFDIREDQRDKNGVRLIRDIDLMEVSVVALPASQEAQIQAVRSRADWSKFLSAARDAATILRGK